MALYLLTPSETATAWLFCGQVRSGKSYHAAQIIEKWLRGGGHVITNMQINLPKGRLASRRYKGIVKTLPSVLEVIEGVRDFRPTVEGHILLVMDEVASCFDARNFAKFPKDLRAFLAQHAKMRISIITIVHRPSLVDTTFRQLAGYAVEHKAMARASGFFGLFCGLLMPGLMYRHTEGMTSSGEMDGNEVERKFFFGKQKIYDFYDTFQIAEGSFAGSTTLKHGVIRSVGFRRKLIFVAIIYCLFRFTPFNNLPRAPGVVASSVAPFVVLSGQVRLCGSDGLCDIETSSGEFFKMKPLPEWGSNPVEWLDKFVALEIPTTAPVLRNYTEKERIKNAAAFQQKK